MSTRRATRASSHHQQHVNENNLHTRGDEEVEVDPRVLNNLSQKVRDFKAQMASMQANFQLIANQLTLLTHHTHAFLMSAYFCPHLMFNFGYLIEFVCLKSDLVDNSDN